MKVSEYLREYQLTGKVPNPENSMCSFWAGWMIGNASRMIVTTKDSLEMAILAAEFIEAQK